MSKEPSVWSLGREWHPGGPDAKSFKRRKQPTSSNVAVCVQSSEVACATRAPFSSRIRVTLPQAMDGFSVHAPSRHTVTLNM